MRAWKYGIATAAAALLSIAEIQAGLGGVPTDGIVNAVGACQGALPSFEGSLRKRPLAIANEGTTLAFVTCSLADDVRLPFLLQLAVTNRSASDVSLSCTMVGGSSADASSTVQYFPKSVEVGANNVMGFTWLAHEDAAADHFSSPSNFSCALPPGVEINWIYRASGDNPFTARRKP